jgi:hypothetical protein
VLACGEKIKATISLPRGTGDHQLKVLWVRPDGGVEQETTVKVKLSDQGQGNAMVWLLLNPEKDTVFPIFPLVIWGERLFLLTVSGILRFFLTRNLFNTSHSLFRVITRRIT